MSDKKILIVATIKGTKKSVKNDIKLLDNKVKADWSKKGE